MGLDPLVLGNVAGGVNEGLRRIDARDDREQNRELRGLQIEGARQNLDNAQYASQRRRSTDAEGDLARQRMKEGQEALRQFMTAGQVDPVVNFANRYTPDGVRHFLARNDDGTYQAILDVNGKKEERTISQDEIGEYMMTLITNDPMKLYASQAAAVSAAKAKQGDRDFDIRRLREEYRLKERLEWIKAGAKGKTPDMTLKTWNALWSRAAKARGLDANSLDFESQNGRLASFDAALAVDYVNAGLDVNAAHLRARSVVDEIDRQVRAGLDRLDLDEAAYDSMYMVKMTEALDQVAARARPKQGLDPSGTANPTPGAAAPDAPKPDADPGSEIPEAAIQALIAGQTPDGTPVNDEQFDLKYGKGAAARVRAAHAAGAAQEGAVPKADARAPKRRVERPALTIPDGGLVPPRLPKQKSRGPKPADVAKAIRSLKKETPPEKITDRPNASPEQRERRKQIKAINDYNALIANLKKDGIPKPPESGAGLITRSIRKPSGLPLAILSTESTRRERKNIATTLKKAIPYLSEENRRAAQAILKQIQPTAARPGLQR